jgi:hypothetical protein
MFVKVLCVFFFQVQCVLSLTQDLAIKRCQRGLDVYADIEKNKNKDALLVIKNLVIQEIDKLKNTKTITDIPYILDRCLQGVEAIGWVLTVDPEANQSVSLIEKGPEVNRVEQEKQAESDKKQENVSEKPSEKPLEKDKKSEKPKG